MLPTKPKIPSLPGAVDTKFFLGNSNGPHPIFTSQVSFEDLEPRKKTSWNCIEAEKASQAPYPKPCEDPPKENYHKFAKSEKKIPKVTRKISSPRSDYNSAQKCAKIAQDSAGKTCLNPILVVLEVMMSVKNPQPSQIPVIADLLRSKFSVGMIGGHEKQAYYMLGEFEKNFLY